MRRTCIAIAIAALASPAIAEEPTLGPDDDKLASTAVDNRPKEKDTRAERYTLVAIESGVLLGGVAALYWGTAEKQKHDWALKWDKESWRLKLTSSDTIRFDSNPLTTNTFGHTAQSIGAYQIGRGNGLGFAGALLLNAGHTLVWEYLVEHREYPSINDVIVNTASGPAFGEPLWQVGDYFRSGPKSITNEVLATVFSPFDEIERRVTKRGWRSSARPWHRFRVWGGASGATFGGEQTGAGAVGADLEVASFDHSGARDGWTPAGGWSRITAQVNIDGDGVRASRVHSRTSYGGYQTRAVFEDGLGRSAFYGFGTGITYESSRLAMERDQMATYHLIGPQAELHLRTRIFDVRWQSAAYGDLGLVHAYAIGTMPPADRTPPFDSPLPAHGYYYGVGTTAWTRLLVGWRDWHADVEAHGHQLWSLDKKQQERGDVEAPKDVADGRLFGRLTLGYSIVPGWLVLDGTLDLIGRRGTLGNIDRRGSEQRAGVQLTLAR